MNKKHPSLVRLLSATVDDLPAIAEEGLLVPLAPRIREDGQQIDGNLRVLWTATMATPCRK